MTDHDRAISFLLVEDDPDDVEIIRRALRQVACPVPLHVVSDGEEAWEFLTNTGRYAGQTLSLPSLLVLLDLNLPRMDGQELLRRIKRNLTLRRVPVVVLTTSEHDQDVLRAYDEGANTFITKPPEFAQFLVMVDRVCRYWRDTATCPDREAVITGIPVDGETILVIDNDESVRELLALLLSRMGYRALLADEGAQGLQMIDDAKQVASAGPSLVILDTLLLGLTSREVMRRLRERHPDIRVVFTSGFHCKATAIEALVHSPDGFLPKPFAMEEMEHVIQSALGN